MKRYLLTIIIACLSLWAMAANTISLASVSGTPQTEVEVAVSLDNSDAISALEITIPIGEHLQYVNGSTILVSSRSNGHQISAAQVAQELRIYVYSFSSSTLRGNSGELLRFRLKLGNEPADYELMPSIILSSAQGTSLECIAEAGVATILAPKLQIITEQIDYGHIPIRAIYTKNLQLKNVGTLPLEITNIAIDDALITPAQTTLTISPSSTANVTLTYAPVERGAIMREVIVSSNAVNSEQVATIVADPFSVNELHVGSASGIADNLVTISLTMNNMEPIVAMQCEFVLPKELEFVANSLVVNSERQNGHLALSTLRGDTLVLALFSMSNQALKGNDGEIATFQVRLNGNSGDYGLYPQDVVLGNITEENMVSANYEGWVTIQSPSLYGEDYLHCGSVPITEQVIANYPFNNYGDAPLQIERVTFLAEGYSVVTPLPLVVNPWEESQLQIAYTPSAEGDFSTTMNLYTNDPNSRLKTVALSGTVYEPNTLSIDGEIYNDSFILSVSLNNYTNVVAVQYDIHTQEDMITSQSAFKSTDRMQDHNYVVTNMGNGIYRVIIYSMSNNPLVGNEGVLHQLVFSAQSGNGFCDKEITLDNIILSSADGKNKVSQSTIFYSLPKAKRENFSLTACDSYTWNGETYTESGNYTYITTAANGCDSVVTLHLTINHTEREDFYATACNEYSWHGNTYYESGDYEYRTNIYESEKLYVGYDSQYDPIIGLTPPRGVSRFTVDGFITEGGGSCFVGTGSPENSIVDDEGDLRIFDAGSFYYDRMGGRQEGFLSDYRTPFNIEFGNYYAKDVENGEYYFKSEEVYEYSNAEYPLTLFYNDYGKIHKVQFFDNNNLLWADINAVVENGVPMIKINYYNENGTIYQTQQFTEHLSAETITLIAERDCDRVETLHLTINETQYAEESVIACDSYTWNGETYTTSGEYVYTTIAANGCDSIVTLHLTINYSDTAYFDATACNSYTWHGEEYTKSGTYEYLTQTTHGCDSLEILTLTIHNSAITEVAITACDAYTWDNQKIYTESGTYYQYLQTLHGCDSTVVLHLTINYTKYTEEMAVACDTYTWNGNTYTQSGDYTYTTTAANGCDSIVTLHLTINATKYAEKTVTACDSYTWNGETYTESGEYTYTTTASNGCDSIVTLHLTINQTQYAEETVTACDNYIWNGETYTASGEYTYTTTAANGCDSIVTLHLTINATKYTEETETACDSYVWNGETYTTGGEYVYTTTASNGCDSIVTLHLTINNTQYAEETITACDSYTWNDETYTESGEYTYTTTAANGCDSIVTLHLTINATKYAEETVTACDNYTWNGKTYTESGEYTYNTTAANGCDSIITLHLTINQSEVGDTEYATICYGETYTWNGQTYAVAGEYGVTLTNAAGCDSIATLHLTIMPEAVTTTETVVIGSDELPYTWRGNTYLVTGRYTDIEQYTQVDCDSAIHVLDLTVLTTGNFDEESITICETEAPYIWYGESYAATGKYTYTEKYTGTYIDSVQHILNLTVNPTKYTEETIIACDSYTWNGNTYTASGEYTYNTIAANGCDSIVTLHLTINATQYAEETAIACDSYTWNDETYTESGKYTYNTTAANGCDSIVTLHLTINATQYAEETVVACDGYTWNGETYTESGEYTYTTTASNGCDSIVTLHLTINNTQYAEETVVACDGYTWNGETYTESGEYVYTTAAANGCDSIVTLHLTINKTQYAEETVTACDSYVWNGERYTASGEYTYTTTAANGCDSIVTLHLTINKSEREEYTAVVCDEYIWNGVIYTESGDYTYTTTTAAGCERVEVLHLTINKSEHVEFTETACDSYVWNGVTYTESGDYTYTTTTAAGCERVEVLHLTINKSKHIEETVTACDEYYWDHNGETYYESGDYEYYTTTEQGCERVEVLHLTILPVATTESEEIALCPSELPYEWYGQWLTEEGTYSATEQYVGMECDSVIHELTLNVYVQTLPAAVTLPIVRTGEAIDVTTPTAEIQAHIAAETWYAPNAEVAWYIMDNSDWAALSTDPVATGFTEVTLKYVVDTDCGNVESDKMVINLKTTDMENTQSQSTTSNCRKVLYEDHIYILREDKIYNAMGQEL